MWWTVWLACPKSNDEPAPPLEAPPPEVAPVEPPAAPPEGAPSTRDALARLFAAHDGVACADAEATVAEPVPALVDLVENVQMPPTVPMRAAQCLIDGHAVEAAAAIEGWMAGAETRGLAILVAGRIDQFPAEVATRFAAAGMAGPHADEIRDELAASTRAEVRALAPAP